MRQTLATYHQPDAKWSSTPDADVRRPPPGLAQQLRVLFLARDDPALFIGLKAVSCVFDSLLHLEPLRKLLSKYVLVVRGPVAADFWQVQDMDGNAPPYRQAVCFNCTTFSLHGSCEHVHAAWLHGGQLDSRAAHIPALGRKRVPAQQAVPSVLRPGPARPSSSASAPRSLLPNCWLWWLEVPAHLFGLWYLLAIVLQRTGQYCYLGSVGFSCHESVLSGCAWSSGSANPCRVQKPCRSPSQLLCLVCLSQNVSAAIRSIQRVC